MKNVYDHRATHIEMKKAVKSEENWLLDHEKRNI